MRVASLAGLQLAGIWLMLLIASSVFTAVVIFGATQFQIRLANLSLYGGPLSVWKAEELRQGWAASLDVLEAAKQIYNNDQQALAQALTASSEADAQARVAAEEGESAYQQITEKVRRVDPDLGKRFADAPKPDGVMALIAANPGAAQGQGPVSRRRSEKRYDAVGQIPVGQGHRRRAER